MDLVGKPRQNKTEKSKKVKICKGIPETIFN